MKYLKIGMLSICLLAVLGLFGAFNIEPGIAAAQDDDSLVSILVEEAPELDGVADEAFWEEATAIEIPVDKGANMESTTVMVKSVYTADSVYFLVSYADPTESWARFPWEMQEDGTWIQLKDPDNVGEDDNMWYEDKFAMIWPITEIEDFETDGCFVACHRSREGDPKPYGDKFLVNEGELGDIWHWKSVRNIGQLHDQWLDSTEWSVDTPSAGRHSDPADEGGYFNNKNEEGTAPAYMPAGDDFAKDGSPGYLLPDEMVEFDASLFEPGDRLPGIYKTPFVGDGGDISAGWVYADGMWTLEFGRLLDTGSEYDVQFTDLTVPYYFGVAVFDNAQVRHAFQEDASMMVFGE